MNNDHYVYILFRDTGIPFYVGMGRKRRWLDHEERVRPGRSYKDNIIAEMLRSRRDVPKIKVAENLTKDEAWEIEKSFFAAIGRRPYGPLVNLTCGGDGVCDPSEETRELKRIRMTGTTVPKGVREKIRAKLKGRPLPPEVIQKMSATRKGRPGRPHSPETRAKIGDIQRGKRRGPRRIPADHRQGQLL
jgi:NUMOD3 motif